MKYIFGVDLGGTNIKFGIFKLGGELIYNWSVATDKYLNGSNITLQISNELEKAIKKQNICKDSILGIGLSVPGVVYKDSIVDECVNIGWKNYNPAYEIEKNLNIKCYVLNDAEAAGLGESIYGAGKGYKNMFVVTIGTGVGGAVIIDKKVISGTRGNAGEIGHFTVDINSEIKCSCGKYGCLEQYSSAPAILRFANENLCRYKNSALNNINNFTVKDIAECAKNGDEFCLNVFDTAGKYIALGISYVAGTIDPDVFIVGGGVSAAGDIILKPIEKYFKSFAFNTENEIPIKQAALLNNAGIYGASEFVGIKLGGKSYD